MAYFILMGRRIPKQAITGFKFQNETDNIRPFLSIRIRGKDEIIPFKDKKGDTVRKSASVFYLLRICKNRRLVSQDVGS
jgi:hypothetical protein